VDVTTSGTPLAPGEPDDRDLDEGGLDLTPRSDELTPRRSRTSRRWGALVVLALLGVALVFIVIQARGASVYFKNADEAVAQRKELGTKRFRLQGTVVSKPVSGSEAMDFRVAYNGVAVRIRHTGAEPPLFKPGIPIVAEGHWNAAGTVFDSDRILVKHTESYTKAHPTRLTPNTVPVKKTS